MNRLAFCYSCKTLSKLPGWDGHPQNDVLLIDWIERHGHGLNRDADPGEPGAHPGGRLFAMEASMADTEVQYAAHEGSEHLSAMEMRDVESVKAELLKANIEVYAYRDELREDAAVCFRKHGNPDVNDGRGCRDYQDDSKRLGRKDTPKAFKQYLCTYCLAGETMVVTRTGVRPISELVGEAELLVVPTNGNHASWKTVPVRSYGVQQLWEVELQRGRQKRSIFATGEHRWAINGKPVVTAALVVGDVLDRSAATPLSLTGEIPSSVGVMHGFTFGDGTRGAGNRPGYVTIYDNGKDKALHPYFAGCRSTGFDNGVSTGLNYVDLPKAWKDAPSLDESRSYLLGFLAGYFAADGAVSASGQAVIHSSVRENIEMVRTLCNTLGVQTAQIQTKSRVGFGKLSDMYSTTIRTQDLPGEFWIIEAHAARTAQRTTDTRRNWSVVSVAPTVRLEEVFCADVGGSERFVLDDNLVTYNCPYESSVTIAKRWARGDYKA